MRIISCVLVALFLGACVSTGGSSTSNDSAKATKKERVFKNDGRNARD